MNGEKVKSDDLVTNEEEPEFSVAQVAIILLVLALLLVLFILAWCFRTKIRSVCHSFVGNENDIDSGSSRSPTSTPGSRRLGNPAR